MVSCEICQILPTNDVKKASSGFGLRVPVTSTPCREALPNGSKSTVCDRLGRSPLLGVQVVGSGQEHETREPSPGLIFRGQPGRALRVPLCRPSSSSRKGTTDGRIRIQVDELDPIRRFVVGSPLFFKREKTLSNLM